MNHLLKKAFTLGMAGVLASNTFSLHAQANTYQTLEKWRSLNKTSYTAAQGICASQSTVYVAKQNKKQKVRIYAYTETGSSIFTEKEHALGHANDMTCDEDFLYVAVGGGKSQKNKKSDTDLAIYGGIIAFNLNDPKQTKKYKAYNTKNKEFKPSGIEYDEGRDIFYLKKGGTIYIAKKDDKKKKIKAISAITINTGDCQDWTYQGLSYQNDTIYVPVWNEKNMTQSAILEYKVEDSVDKKGKKKVKIQKDPMNTTYYQSANSKDKKFEIEGLAFDNTSVYFATNGEDEKAKQKDVIYKTELQ